MKLAIIGCGAITEMFYLPALARYKSIINNCILVDKNESRLQSLMETYNVKGTLSNYASIISEVDGVIIATPPEYHHPIAMDFLSAGVPVLCEKPLAETALHVEQLIETAYNNDCALLVNNTRRFFPNHMEIFKWIKNGKIGEVTSISYVEGAPFMWPTVSGFYFSGKSSKGVMLDRGPHVLDLVTWWAGKALEIGTYQDDSMPGPEAVADVTLYGDNFEGHVRLSWLSKLQNEFIITGTNGSISGSIYDWKSFNYSTIDGKTKKVNTPSKIKLFSDFADLLLNNYFDVIKGLDKPAVSGEDVLPSITLIDQCYQTRQQFEMPWHLFHEVPQNG